MVIRLLNKSSGIRDFEKKIQDVIQLNPVTRSSSHFDAQFSINQAAKYKGNNPEEKELLDFVKEIQVIRLLNKSSGIRDFEKKIQDVIQINPVTRSSSHFDAQFSINQAAKYKGNNPEEKELLDFVKEIQVSGGGERQFLKLEHEVVAKEVIGFIRHCGSCYGYTDPEGLVAKNGTVIVEYSSPNIAKPFHAGHLRSTVIGNYIANLYEKLGYNVIRLNYLGDWGTQFGLLAVGFQQYGDENQLEENPMQHLFEVYVKINQKVLEDKARNENTTFAAGLEAFQRMENGDENLLSLWNKFRKYSIEDYSKTYSRLGVQFTEYHSESMYHHQSLELVENLRKQGLVSVDDEGRSYVEVNTVSDMNTKAYLLKSDGTTLYMTRDVAALLDRHKKYNFDKIHYVVQDAQYSHFQQLIGIMKRAVSWSNKLTDDVHVRFGRVEGMSTRKGEVVFLKDILDEAQQNVLETMTRKNTTKVTENLTEVADLLGASAIIVQDLSQHIIKNYKFSWERALKMKSDSGIFLQYAHARLCNLEANCDVPLEESFDPSHLTNKDAQLLLLHLARYEDVVQKSFVSLEPYYTVHYLCRLCHFVNKAYRTMTVKNEEPDIAQAHLQLFHASRITLANGMRLLGLTPVEKM